MSCCSCCCLVRRSPARRRPTSLFDSRTLHEVRLYIQFARSSRASGAIPRRLLRSRRISSGAASACATSACACAGLRRRSPIKPGLRDRLQSLCRRAGISRDGGPGARQRAEGSVVRAREHEHGVHQADGAAGAARVVRARVHQRRVRGALCARRSRSTASFSRASLETGSVTCSSTSSRTGFYGEFLGDDYAPYKLRFEAQTHRLESDYTLYAPIRELFREVNQDVDTVWRERVGWFVDLNQVITHVAIETFLARVRRISRRIRGWRISICIVRLRRNVHRLIAWDRDTTFQDDRVADLRAGGGQRAHEPSAAVPRSTRAVPRRARAVRARGRRRIDGSRAEIYQAHQLIRDAAYEDGDQARVE